MTKKQTSKEGFPRWWEFYAVRYAMGTVVGAIIFHILCSANPILQPLLFESPATALSPSMTLDAAHLILLSAYGLVYCYIASAPILVFHAGRFLLQLDTRTCTKVKWAVICLSIPIVSGILSYLFPPAGAVNQVALYSASVFVLSFILWLQTVIVYRTLVHNANLYRFYVNLSARREADTGEIIESYRHLREHGNSFFIVFMEIGLAVVLFGTGMLTSQFSSVPNAIVGPWAFHLMIIVAWILPAVFVWVIATVLERRFCDDEAEPGVPPDR